MDIKDSIIKESVMEYNLKYVFLINICSMRYNKIKILC